MNRTPPQDVRRQLRREVGFGCPVCGNPYLAFHHFDPPWREEQHHDPERMIALCAEHHAKADAGGYTKEQLRQLKRQGAERNRFIRGRFAWMRRDLLGIVGGNFYLDVQTVLSLRNERVIWFTRAPDGSLLLNIRMLTTSGEPRAIISENDWLSVGSPTDLESPPHGRLLRIDYSNGDMLRVEFFELGTAEAVNERYPLTNAESWGIPFPLTAVEVRGRVAGTDIEFGPEATTFTGVSLVGNVFRGWSCALAIGSEHSAAIALPQLGDLPSLGAPPHP